MKRAPLALGTALALTFFLAPFAVQVLTSFRPEAEVARLGLPSHFTLEAYRTVLRDGSLVSAILNSLVVASATTLVCLTVGATASFALAKLNFAGQKLLLGVALAISMFPPIATVSPVYLGLTFLGLRDSLVGLVLPYSTFALPLTLWLLTSYFAQVPDGLYRAARVDGCTPFQAFLHVLLPLAFPGVATTAILVFILSWNEFLFALTLLSSPEKHTVPVAISLFAGEHAEPWAELFAASLLATLPLVLVTVLCQRRIVSGLTAGALKE
jgi:multiple sugar transport system permease protein